MRGDDLDNDILIEQGGSADAFDITGLNGTDIILNGSYYGSGPVTAYGVTGNMQFKMADGNDVVTLSSVEVLGNLRFDGGAGSNSLITDPSIVYGSSSVKNRDGLDMFLLADTTVNGSVGINNGRGGSVTTITNSSTVWGKLAVKNKGGHDIFVLRDSEAKSSVKIDNYQECVARSAVELHRSAVALDELIALLRNHLPLNRRRKKPKLLPHIGRPRVYEVLPLLHVVDRGEQQEKDEDNAADVEGHLPVNAVPAVPHGAPSPMQSPARENLLCPCLGPQ
jgi:hypothetical protein